eukprot:gene1335-776_t
MSSNPWRRQEHPSEAEAAAPPAPATTIEPGPIPGSPPSPVELGNSGWNILHSAAAQKDAMEKFIHGWSFAYACNWCAYHMRLYLKDHPPLLEDKHALSQYMCRFHNNVNEHLHKPLYDCEDVDGLLRRWHPGYPDRMADRPSWESRMEAEKEKLRHAKALSVEAVQAAVAKISAEPVAESAAPAHSDLVEPHVEPESIVMKEAPIRPPAPPLPFPPSIQDIGLHAKRLAEAKSAHFHASFLPAEPKGVLQRLYALVNGGAASTPASRVVELPSTFPEGEQHKVQAVEELKTKVEPAVSGTTSLLGQLSTWVSAGALTGMTAPNRETIAELAESKEELKAKVENAVTETNTMFGRLSTWFSGDAERNKVRELAAQKSAEAQELKAHIVETAQAHLETAETIAEHVKNEIGEKKEELKAKVENAVTETNTMFGRLSTWFSGDAERNKVRELAAQKSAEAQELKAHIVETAQAHLETAETIAEHVKNEIAESKEELKAKVENAVTETNTMFGRLSTWFSGDAGRNKVQELAAQKSAEAQELKAHIVETAQAHLETAETIAEHVKNEIGEKKEELETKLEPVVEEVQQHIAAASEKAAHTVEHGKEEMMKKKGELQGKYRPALKVEEHHAAEALKASKNHVEQAVEQMHGEMAIKAKELLGAVVEPAVKAVEEQVSHQLQGVATEIRSAAEALPAKAKEAAAAGMQAARNTKEAVMEDVKDRMEHLEGSAMDSEEKAERLAHREEIPAEAVSQNAVNHLAQPFDVLSSVVHQRQLQAHTLLQQGHPKESFLQQNVYFKKGGSADPPPPVPRSAEDLDDAIDMVAIMERLNDCDVYCPEKDDKAPKHSA